MRRWISSLCNWRFCRGLRRRSCDWNGSFFFFHGHHLHFPWMPKIHLLRRLKMIIFKQHCMVLLPEHNSILNLKGRNLSKTSNWFACLESSKLTQRFLFFSVINHAFLISGPSVSRCRMYCSVPQGCRYIKPAWVANKQVKPVLCSVYHRSCDCYFPVCQLSV